ncbi:hypothetical protein Tco_1507030 [Tanacetum coccineum]
MGVSTGPKKNDIFPIIDILNFEHIILENWSHNSGRRKSSRLQDAQIHSAPLALLQSNMIELMRLIIFGSADDSLHNCRNHIEDDASESFSRLYTKNGSLIHVMVHLGQLLFEEGEPVDTAGSRATTSVMDAMIQGWAIKQ